MRAVLLWHLSATAVLLAVLLALVGLQATVRRIRPAVLWAVRLLTRQPVAAVPSGSVATP